ncbi:hypothetical protein [Teredinibacter haidensis]|uniref:hypothetical protein n=1 Tax=Teredinibacter haidensis TaxID=2731755 RepID=UPI000948DE2B|nr:hypothetical protein [Teredinibacter haidensis]
MVGAVIEGLLFDKFGNRNFNSLIEKAKAVKLLNANEAIVIDSIRNTRNKIHANKYNEDIAGRKEALQLSAAYDRLLKKNWGT